MDAGRPPPPDFSAQAHAGTLSFEFSVEGQPIIVNCGAPDPAATNLRQAARATAAHSTLVVSDVSSSRFASESGIERWLGHQIVARPSNVPVTRREEESGVTIEASHDGYEQRFGLIHWRRLQLSADGECLEGLDALKASGRRVPGTVSAEYILRFHLHPSVLAEHLGDGRTLVLTMPSGAHWQFSAGGRSVEIEESIFFASPDGPRPTEQIVIRAKIRDVSTIAWRLERVASG
jgi:uncharacterized heparinase superfamily protein